MALPELNLFTNAYREASEALPELADVALAEVGIDGYIINLNAFGKAVWGWKEGDKLPAPVFSTLCNGKPLSLPDQSDGRRILGTGVRRQQGWLVVGYHEKRTSSLRQESSFRTLIENIPPVNHPFIDQAPQGILFLDRNGDVIFSNQQFRDFIHANPDASNADNAFKIFEFDTALTGQLRGLLSEGSPLVQQTIILQPQSEFPSVPLRINGSAVHDTKNTILGAVITLESHQEKKEAVPASTTHVSADHDQLAQLKNVFIAMMSHEIRTPLGVMNGYAEILGQELEDYETSTGNVLPPQVKEFVGAIHENAQRLLGVVNELFDLSNMRQVTLSPISLHQTLQVEAEKARQVLERKNVQFESVYNDADLIVLSNAKRLGQVLKNLLSNAAKFTHQGEVSICTRREGMWAVIEIADTGIGISEEYMQQLFTPFWQEDTRLNRQFPGTGLGLALVKLLLDLMNGRIEVDSKKGQGSTFRIYLPIAE